MPVWSEEHGLTPRRVVLRALVSPGQAVVAVQDDGAGGPEGPGLGLEVNEAEVRANKGKQFPARTFRTPQDEGP